jgi:hypothetical protein
VAAASISLEISLASTIDDASFSPARARLHALVIARDVGVLAIYPLIFKTVQAKSRECGGDVPSGNLGRRFVSSDRVMSGSARAKE